MERQQGQTLEEMPICWRPGKSPMMVQTGGFGRTESQERLRPGTAGNASGRVGGDEGGHAEGQESEEKDRRWYIIR